MTAVEWLVEQTESLITIETFHKWKELKHQAKAMEKEQHGETWDAALIHVDKRGGVVLRALVDFYEYWDKYQKV